ncbi:MAG: AI-2E family transporter [Bacteriovoracaceae bacterium]
MNNYIRGFSVLIVFTLVIIGFAFVLGETFNSLIIAFISAYFLFPFIEKVENLGIPRPIVTIGLILFILSIIFVVLYFSIPAIFFDLRKFLALLPEKISLLVHILIAWGDRLGFNLGDVLKKYSNQEYIIDWIENNVSQFSNFVLIPIIKISGKGLIGLREAVMSLLNLFIVPVFFFFLVNSYEKITAELKALLPEKQRAIAINYLGQLNNVLSGYFRGQIGLSLCVSAYYALALSLVNIHFGLLIGLVTGLLNMVPYVGITISIILSILSVSFYSTNIPLDLSLVALVYGFEVILEIVYLYPKFVGSKIGLKPLEVMLALAAGANVGGVIGALISVPLAAVLKVALGDAIRYYKCSDIYTNSSL